MPTSTLGLALYVFALFPGLAFIFAREGHRPPAKRSAFRETATVVFVSVVCDALIGLLVVLGSLVDDSLRTRVVELLSGDSTWVRQNFAFAYLLFLSAITLSTLLGLLLGGPWAHSHGLDVLWRAEVKRDVSAWRSILAPDFKADVRVGLTLRSGAYISGGVYEFDPDPNNGPNRTITLQSNLMYRAPGQSTAASVENTEWIVIEAADIEVLQASYFEPTELSSASNLSAPKSWAPRPVTASLAVAMILSALGAATSGGHWLSLGGLWCVVGLFSMGVATWRALRE